MYIRVSNNAAIYTLYSLSCKVVLVQSALCASCKESKQVQPKSKIPLSTIKTKISNAQMFSAILHCEGYRIYLDIRDKYFQYSKQIFQTIVFLKMCEEISLLFTLLLAIFVWRGNKSPPSCRVKR